MSVNELRIWGPPPRRKSLSVNELRRQLAYQKARICQAQSIKCGEFFSEKNTKKSLSQGRLSCYSLRMEIFAIYRNQIVALLGFEGDEALISFDDGGEEYVAIESLDILP